MSNCPCLICGSIGSDSKYNDKNDDKCSMISKQLKVIFIIKNLLQVPSSQLESYLEKFGNPDSWINLCEKCTQLTGEASSLHFQILQISSQLKTLQNEILRITNRPVNFYPQKLRNNFKVTIWKETRAIVQKHNLDYQANTKTISASQNFGQESPFLNTNDDNQLDNQSDIKIEINTEQEETSSEDSEEEDSAVDDFQNNIEDPHDTYDKDWFPSVDEDDEANEEIDLKHEIPKTSGDFSKITEDTSKREKPISKSPCSCDLCGRSFVNSSNLTKHLQTVHLNKKVACHLCGKRFSSDYIKKHVLFKHKGEKGVDPFYKCGVVGCKLFFVKKEGLEKHMEWKHGNGAAVKPKRFKCSSCGKGFPFRYKLKIHELGHTNEQLGIRPFKCKICGKGFLTPKNLTGHLGSVHRPAKKLNKDLKL